MFQDLFSNHAKDYKQFRPSYPQSLFQYLAGQCVSRQIAWDCGTGNGQSAFKLAELFENVYASDGSYMQLKEAALSQNILYYCAYADKSALKDNSISLVTVSQALHWFDCPLFFKEVKRVLIDKGIIAIIGYHTVLTGIKEIDTVYKDFCFKYLWEKECWAKERAILNNNYQTIDFPFETISSPSFDITMRWQLDDYINYLNTWSATKKHIKKYQKNPVDRFILPKIQSFWPNGKALDIKIPIILRLGRTS